MTAPLEGRLRGAHELVAAGVSLAAGGAVLIAPGWLLLSPPWQFGLAAVLLGHAAWRGGQGARILAYRRNLRRLRGVKMDSASIPWSAHRLYLGRGFRWDQRHTQRLFEARQPANQRLLAPSRWARLLPGPASLGDAPAGLGGDPLMPAGLKEIGEALRARLDGPWLWPEPAPDIAEADGAHGLPQHQLP